MPTVALTDTLVSQLKFVSTMLLGALVGHHLSDGYFQVAMANTYPEIRRTLAHHSAQCLNRET